MMKGASLGGEEIGVGTDSPGPGRGFVPAASNPEVSQPRNPDRVQLKNLAPRHEEIVNWLLTNPEKSLLECARTYHVTQAWLSCIVHSDIFQARYQKLLGQDRDVRILPLREKILGLANAAVDSLTTQQPFMDPEMNLDLAGKMLKAAGYGAPKPAGFTVNAQNVAFVSAVSAEDLEQARQNHREFQRRLADESMVVESLPEVESK